MASTGFTGDICLLGGGLYGFLHGKRAGGIRKGKDRTGEVMAMAIG